MYKKRAEMKTITQNKKWEHIPVRPSTFEEFRRLKQAKSDNAFVIRLLSLYQRHLDNKAKKEAEREAQIRAVAK